MTDLAVTAEILANHDSRLDNVDTHLWATCTNINPVEVQIDGTESPLPGRIDTIADISPGQRVLCLRMGRRLVVLGSAKNPK